MDMQSDFDSTFDMTLADARDIVRDPASSPAALLAASHTICESSDATIADLVACTSLRFRSAAWRPAHLLHERTGVPKQFDDSGFIVIDHAFWRDYLSRLPRLEPASDSRNA
jgi:hypothetical protein